MSKIPMVKELEDDECICYCTKCKKDDIKKNDIKDDHLVSNYNCPCTANEECGSCFCDLPNTYDEDIELTYSQKYWKENKEQLKSLAKEKTQCECGRIVARINLWSHKKTKLHANRLRHKEYLAKKIPRST